jgi:hypothetical protein
MIDYIFLILLIGLCLYMYDIFYLRKKKHKNKKEKKEHTIIYPPKDNITQNSLDDVLTILNE